MWSFHNYIIKRIKKITVLASLTVWDDENGVGQPTTTKIVIDTWPDLIRLK